MERVLVLAGLAVLEFGFEGLPPQKSGLLSIVVFEIWWELRSAEIWAGKALGL